MRRVQFCLFAGVFGFGIRFREIGVVVLQHFVLIAMAELACEGAVLGAASGFGVRRVVFHCALAHSFVRASHSGSVMRFSCALDNGLIVARAAGWLGAEMKRLLSSWSVQARCIPWSLVNLMCQWLQGGVSLLPDEESIKAAFDYL